MSQVAVDRAACVQRPSLSDAARGGGGGRREREEGGARSLLPALPLPPRHAQLPLDALAIAAAAQGLQCIEPYMAYMACGPWHGQLPFSRPAGQHHHTTYRSLIIIIMRRAWYCCP
jgi:hypothetical protein